MIFVYNLFIKILEKDGSSRQIFLSSLHISTNYSPEKLACFSLPNLPGPSWAINRFQLNNNITDIWN